MLSRKRKSIQKAQKKIPRSGFKERSTKDKEAANRMKHIRKKVAETSENVHTSLKQHGE